MNKKGFTLVELLAVIVILGLLATVAILSMSRVLENARKDVYLANARAAIDAARNDYMVNPDSASKWEWSLSDINGLLEKKLANSPFGESYSAVFVWRTTGGIYKVCMRTENASGGFILETAEDLLKKDSVLLTGTPACATKGSTQPSS